MSLKIGPEIGHGSFATVCKGELDGRPVAVKSVLRDKLSDKLLDNLRSEISILKAIQHPHIVALLDYRQKDARFHLIMEYCSLGDLSYFMRNKTQLKQSLPLVASMYQRYPDPNPTSSTGSSGLNPLVAQHFVQQLASALTFLRNYNLVHRDVKPQNLLLCPPPPTAQAHADLGYAGTWELPVLKLADFGFARILPSTALAETLCGSPLYMAPEILRYEKYNAKADLWSVGAVLYEMLVGKPPFRAANHVELLKRIEANNDRIVLPETLAHLDPDMTQLVRGLLRKSPSERIGFQEFFASPVLTKSCASNRPDWPLDRSGLDDNLFISDYVAASSSAGRNPTVITSAGQDAASTVMQVVRANAGGKQRAYAPIVPGTVASENSGTLSKVASSQPSSSASPPRTASSSSRSPSTSGPNLTTTTKPCSGTVASPSTSYVLVEKRAVEVNALADEVATPLETRRAISRAALNRRSSIGYGASPTSALARALSLASARLFAAVPLALSPYQTAAAAYVSPSPSPDPVPVAANAPEFSQYSIPATIDAEERKLIRMLELLATRAKVVSVFADVKFAQLVPEGDKETGKPGDDDSDQQEYLHLVSQEAIALYVKTLSLLARAMDLAAEWWRQNEQAGASTRLNDTVQWIRNRFNDCLDKAEYAQAVLVDTKGQAVVDSSITAERLLYDRALEMSRAAAINELTGQDPAGSELSYGTALWMLEALVEPVGDEGLDEEDKQMVERFMTSISKRLFVLRGRAGEKGSGELVRLGSRPIQRT